MEQTVAGRHQHRHPRHRPRLGLDRRPDPRPGTGHRRRLGADLLREGEPGGLRRRPDRARRPRRGHRDHLRRGAGLPADRPRGADGLRPGDGRVRPAASPRTSTSSSTGSRTPATATPSATTAARAPPPRAGQVSGWIEDELLSNGVFQVACSVGRAVPADHPRRSPGSPAAPCPPAPTPTSRTRCSPARAGCASWRWSTPFRARPPWTALRELKAMVDRSPLRVSFPVEVRTAPGRRHRALHRLGPGQRVHRRPHVQGHAATRRTSPPPSGS